MKKNKYPGTFVVGAYLTPLAIIVVGGFIIKRIFPLGIGMILAGIGLFYYNKQLIKKGKPKEE